MMLKFVINVLLKCQKINIYKLYMSIIGNIDIFRHILKYINNYHSFYLLNKYYKSLLPKHKLIMYKDLYSCSMYKKKNKYKAIKILQQNKYKNSIHFDNKKQLQISKKYLYREGFYNHYCCKGRGVLFLNYDYNTNRLT